MNRNSVYVILVVIVIAVSFTVLKFVPLKKEEENLFSQTLTLKSIEQSGSYTTTIYLRNGWTVSGSFTSECTLTYTGEGHDQTPTIHIYAPYPDDQTNLFQSSGTASGTIQFFANVEGSCQLIITNPETYFYTTMIVTIEVTQTRVTTFI